MTQPGRLNPFELIWVLVLVQVPGAAFGAAGLIPDDRKADHVLNRIGYGPSPGDLGRIAQLGVAVYLEEQLQPAGLSEADNPRLRTRQDALFVEKPPVRDTLLAAAGTLWRYRKGTSPPDPGWKEVTFDDTSWLLGPTGIGFGDNDDETVLDDMLRIDDNPATPENEGRPGYASVYLRHTFALTAETLAALEGLVLRVDYDDGFKAYLNGTEVARANLPAGDVPYSQTATAGHEAGTPQEFELTVRKNLLRAGANTLAIQVHNQSLTSADLSMIPELVSRKVLPGPALRMIRGINELKQLAHVRGIYSRRQLQTVLAEFWENHFTTDYDKLVDYLDNLQNSDATDAMPRTQAQAEAAQMEYEEYQFLYDHALGHFGDLLLHSATSPTMLVYLDSVLNTKGQPNENYAREILELHTFGVDNRYTQTDIEQLARCFTGWSICKVPRETAPAFPASALTPPQQSGVQYQDTVRLDLGPGWKYFKGTREPAPGAGGKPTTAWAAPGFDDAAWLDGKTGIGYGDNDDATILTDMQGKYLSVYLRRRFHVDDPARFANLILEIAYDDGFVAYLNGVEIARSATMKNTGNPPAFNQKAAAGHEVTEPMESFSLRRFAGALQPGENVLAIQVHNADLASGDLSLLPRLVERVALPGSVENGDRNAVWTFRLRAEAHDTGQKILFKGTPFEIVVPPGRTGQDGLLDATEVIDALVRHPSTAEFICIKLIQRFVSDEITLATYKDGSAPADLVALLRDATTAWNATKPPGNIATVCRAILDPARQANAFWSDRAYRGKVKTAVEYINSSLRVLDADAGGARLAALNGALGMELFTRDEPDGYAELGPDWIDTASMLARLEFVNELAENRNPAYLWDVGTVLAATNPRTAEQVVELFHEMLFRGTLSQETRDLLIRYLATDDDGQPLPLDPRNTGDFQRRVRTLVGLMLSLPQWHCQ